MATIAVIGARSTLGRALVQRVRENGHTVRQIVTTEHPHTPADTATDTFDVVGEVTVDTCAARLQDVDIVVLIATPARTTWAAGAVRAGCALVDSASEQHAVKAVWDTVTSLPSVFGAGFLPGILDLLVAATQQRFVPQAHTISTAVTFPDRRFPPASFRGTRGRRQAVADTLVNGGTRLVAGEHQPELIGERREPVWFPRPVGPQYALGWPSVSALTLNPRFPGIHTVSHAVVAGGWRTELLQAGSNLAGRDRGARWLIKKANKPVGPVATTDLRWACIAELRDGSTFHRAWAYGRDPYRVSAETLLVAIGAILAGDVEPRSSLAGVVSPAQTLDDLTATTGLRWSVSDAATDPLG